MLSQRGVRFIEVSALRELTIYTIERKSNLILPKWTNKFQGHANQAFCLVLTTITSFIIIIMV